DGGIGIFHRAALEVDGDVALTWMIVEEVVLDDLAFVAERQHEVAQASGFVDAHDVPENRASADFHHRLRAKLRFLAEPGAEPAAQNDHLHLNPPDTNDTETRSAHSPMCAYGDADAQLRCGLSRISQRDVRARRPYAVAEHARVDLLDIEVGP